MSEIESIAALQAIQEVVREAENVCDNSTDECREDGQILIMRADFDALCAALAKVENLIPDDDEWPAQADYLVSLLTEREKIATRSQSERVSRLEEALRQALQVLSYVEPEGTDFDLSVNKAIEDARSALNQSDGGGNG